MKFTSNNVEDKEKKKERERERERDKERGSHLIDGMHT